LRESEAKGLVRVMVVARAPHEAGRHEAPELQFVSIAVPATRSGEVGDEILSQRKERLTQIVAETLEAFGHPVVDLRGWRVRLHVRAGDPVDELVALAGEADADLIVIGRFTRSARGGSIADRVVRDAPCPVLIVKLRETLVTDEEACADCVAARRASDGEQWFCDVHSDRRDQFGASTILLPHEDWGLGGGLIA
jgi:nucleotide-binding universal stress UspA family protein